MNKDRWLFLLTGLLLIASHGLAHCKAPHPQVKDGEWRQGYLEGALASSPHLRESKIQVRFEDASIHLTGSVSSPMEKALAEQIAFHTPGVEQVVNRLTVGAGGAEAEGFSFESETQLLANVPINNKVMARLLSHTITRGLKITAETRNRIVIVKGEVPSEIERELVFWLVKNTDGVKAVVDKLEVTHPQQVQAGLQQ